PRPRRRTPRESSFPSVQARRARRPARKGSAVRDRAPRQEGRRVARQTRERSSGRAPALLSRRSSTAEPRRELGDEPNTVAGAAGLRQVVAARAVEKRGAGDVEMRPRPFAGELLQELGGERR